MQQDGQRDQQKGLSLGPKALGARPDVNPETPPAAWTDLGLDGGSGPHPHGSQLLQWLQTQNTPKVEKNHKYGNIFLRRRRQNWYGEGGCR